MALDGSKDYLRMAKSQAVLKLLASFSATNEKVVFSEQVTKINRKGQNQKRVLMLTNRGIYNLEKSKCKRRIDITEVGKVTMSSSSNEFVINVPSEYDYHYNSPKKVEISGILKACMQETAAKELEVLEIAVDSLAPYVVTKADAKKAGNRENSKSLFGSKPSEPPTAQMAAASVNDNDDRLNYQPASGSGGGKVSMTDFDLLKVIGKGSFGKVMLVRKNNGECEGEVFAMKVLMKDAVVSRNQVEHTKAERFILQAVQHPFLVGLRYAFQNEAKLYMVLDYLNGGELFFHLKKSGRFDENRSRIYTAELVLALGHLHSLGIIYRDLKPENILLDNAGHIRVTDFGLAKGNISDNSSAQTFCGTPEYLAPEILSNQGHGRAVDWWSLGTLLYEMLTGLPPYYDTNINTMYRKILQDKLNTSSEVFTADSRDILTKLLDRNAETRLGSGPTDQEELKSHAFFKSIDWEKLLRKEIPAPFKPDVSSAGSVENFDECFTSEVAQDSFVDTSALAGKGNTNFDGFTFAPTSALQK